MPEIDIVQLVEIAGLVVALASALAAATPSDSNNRLVAGLIRLLDALALNWGKRNPRRRPEGSGRQTQDRRDGTPFASLAALLPVGMTLALVTACAPQRAGLDWALLDAMVQTAQGQGVELVDLDADTLARLREACLAGAFGSEFAVKTLRPTDARVAAALGRLPAHLQGACRVALTIGTPVSGSDGPPVPAPKPAPAAPAAG